MLALKFIGPILLMTGSVAIATADGPDFYDVRSVQKNDVLNLRADHSARAEIIFKIPPDAKKIKNLRETWPKYDSDAPPSEETLADRKDLSAEEKKILIKGMSWCKVEYKGKQGWALCRYLGE